MWKKSMPQTPGTSLLLAALMLTGFVDYAKADFNHPTYSSPIALSADNELIWSVNPDDDSVSVIRTDTNQVITKIGVGDEPQSVALDPDNQYAYVANAAAGTVTAIKIKNPDSNKFRGKSKTNLHHRRRTLEYRDFTGWQADFCGQQRPGHPMMAPAKAFR